MSDMIQFEQILQGCSDDAFDGGILMNTLLLPLGGQGSPVKPAIYPDKMYQRDRRWASPSDKEAQEVIVIDNVPSQANRLEDALRLNRASIQLPEFILDFSGIPHLPAHLPQMLSSLQFPHRNADAYLRDSQLKGIDFNKTPLGKDIFASTAQNCAPLLAWFPQSLLYGFWQSHLGKKRSNAKHARAWVSEIIGWNPATTETRTLGVKGDPLNLNVDDPITLNSDDDRAQWEIGKTKGGKEKLSAIGHGQVPFKGGDATLAAVSFERISQRATLSFAQLRRVRIDNQFGSPKNAASRALLTALGLYAHQLAFGRGFSLRSGADLIPKETEITWLGSDSDSHISLGTIQDSRDLVHTARDHALSVGLMLDGWGEQPTMLTPKENLKSAIRGTWPDLTD